MDPCSQKHQPAPQCAPLPGTMLLVKLFIWQDPGYRQSSRIHRLCLCSTDESPQTSKDEPLSELQLQHFESLAIALNWVLYGLPHQAIV